MIVEPLNADFKLKFRLGFKIQISIWCADGCVDTDDYIFESVAEVNAFVADWKARGDDLSLGRCGGLMLIEPIFLDPDSLALSPGKVAVTLPTVMPKE